MIVVAATNVGKQRNNNEDSYYVDKNKKFFILADGMGGHLAGETASGLATQIVSQSLNKLGENSEDSDIIEEIKKSIKNANDEIFNESKNIEKYSGMGTTLTLAYIKNDELFYANIGDSRIYKINKAYKKIEQLTKDDSYVNYLIQIGEITEEEAKVHPKKNVLTKALGTNEKIDFEISKITLENSDVILLCSDGLTNMVSNDDIMKLIINNESLKTHEILIDEALRNGGIDNVTLILVYNE